MKNKCETYRFNPTSDSARESVYASEINFSWWLSC